MKVDIQRIDDASIQLINLRRQLLSVEDSIENVANSLMQQGFGCAAEAAAITDSLILQAKALEQRVDGVSQLVQVLHFAGEQYRRCDAEIGGQAERAEGGMPDASWSDPPTGIAFISPSKEREIVRRYIMPIIMAGKRVIT